MQRVWSWLSLAVGFLMCLTGTGFVALYAIEAIIKRIGEGDQSLLFWYLPLLFAGIAILGLGIGLGAWGYKRLKLLKDEKIQGSG